MVSIVQIGKYQVATEMNFIMGWEYICLWESACLALVIHWVQSPAHIHKTKPGWLLQFVIKYKNNQFGPVRWFSLPGKGAYY